MDTTSIFKAYDIRGTYPDQIDERVADRRRLGLRRLRESPTIVIARDMRTSGETLSRPSPWAFARCGVEVIDLGLASTDFLYFATGYLGVPGAMFTASHNPAQYNGIKLSSRGREADRRRIGARRDRRDDQPVLRRTGAGELAGYSTLDLTKEWVAHVHSFVDVASFRPLKIVADTANGMGGFVAPLVFAGTALRSRDPLSANSTATFPNHPADPLNPENIKDLQRRVLETWRRRGSRL